MTDQEFSKALAVKTADIQADRDTLKADLAIASQKSDAMSSEMASLQKSLTQMSEEFAAARSSANDRRAEFEKELAKAKADQNTSVSEHTKTADALNAEIERLTTKAMKQEKVIDSLTKDNADLAAKIANMEGHPDVVAAKNAETERIRQEKIAAAKALLIEHGEMVPQATPNNG